MRYLFITVSTFSFVFILSGCGAKVTQLEIANPSFESYTDLPSSGNYSSNGDGLIGWTVGIGTDGGVFWPRIPPNTPVNFNSIPDGKQTAWLYGKTICQTLASKVVAGATYTLKVEIGRDAVPTYSGYKIQLRAGGTTLGEDNNSLNPPSGGWLTAQLQYSSPSGDSNAGKSLEICLVGLDNGEADFDNVRLEQSL